jgi:hypothetical protein
MEVYFFMMVAFLSLMACFVLNWETLFPNYAYIHSVFLNREPTVSF